jgi:hypothetical protein
MGCRDDSSVFGFLTHSDEFTPEIMQATSNIRFNNCGRRFKFSNDQLDSVSGRAQNWVDVDGTVSGFGVPTLIGSGLYSVKDWWGVDNEGMLYISFFLFLFDSIVVEFLGSKHTLIQLFFFSFSLFTLTVVADEQAPLKFIKQTNGPKRQIGHVTFTMGY